MTKKHYQALARLLALTQEHYTRQDKSQTDLLIDESNGAIGELASRLADYLASQSARFDRERFMDACQVRINERNTQ